MNIIKYCPICDQVNKISEITCSKCNYDFNNDNLTKNEFNKSKDIHTKNEFNKSKDIHTKNEFNKSKDIHTKNEFNKSKDIHPKNYNVLGGFLGWFIISNIFGLMSSFAEMSYNKVEFSLIIISLFIIQILLILFCFIRKPQSLIIIKSFLLLGIIISLLSPIFTGISDPGFSGWLIVSLGWVGYFFVSKRVAIYFKVNKENKNIKTHHNTSFDSDTNELNTIKNTEAIFENEIKYCRKCGNKLLDNSVFCDKCGLKIAEKEVAKNDMQ